MAKIISVSRWTGIPESYGDWFKNRLNADFAGYITPNMGYFDFTINAWSRVSNIIFTLQDFRYLEKFNLIRDAYSSPRKTEIIEQLEGFRAFVICSGENF